MTDSSFAFPGSELQVNRLKPFCKIHLDKGTQYCFQLAGRETGSAGHGLHHRAVRDQQIRHLQPRTGCSCDIEWVPGTLEAPRRDNSTRMTLMRSTTDCNTLQTNYRIIGRPLPEETRPLFSKWAKHTRRVSTEGLQLPHETRLHLFSLDRG